MSRGSGLLLAGLASVAWTVVGCGADVPSGGGRTVEEAGPAPTARPPLADPPDPGPVPAVDGLGPDVRARAVAATAGVTGLACGRLNVGTAFAVEADLLVTSAHVVVGLEAVGVELADGRAGDASVVGFDGRADIAVLHLPDADLEGLPLADASDGTTGAIVGWEGTGPRAVPFRIDRPVVVRIDDAARTERVERRSWLVAARVGDGDSGAPLVDSAGAVVGVAYAATRREAGVAYAVRSSELAPVLAAASARARVDTPPC